MNWYLWLVQLWAAPAALGFAILFNSPPSTLWRSALLAVLGHLIRDACVHFGIDIVMSTLLAAISIGFCAQFWATQQRQAAPVLSICAAIPMVPGVPMFKTIQSLIDMAREPSSQLAAAYLADAGANAARAIMILFALALGISAPWLLKPGMKVKKKT